MQFRRALANVLPWIVGPAMLGALYLIFLWVPTEKAQGIVQRIFYVHVPSAWTAFLGFAIVAVASGLFLYTGRAKYDRVARAAAEIGMVFCTLVLLTGPLWARPIWGAWWTWDPRLTMTVILWTIYAAYLLLRSFGGADEAIARYAAVLGIVGFLDVPLIRVAVVLWRGIHPTVMQAPPGEGGLDPAMRFTLYVSAICFLLFFTWLMIVRSRMLLVEDEIESIHRRIRPA